MMRLAGGLAARLARRRGGAGGEQFDTDALLRHARFLQRGGHAVHHVFRTADECVVDVFHAQPALEQLAAFVLRDAAVEQLDVLLLAAHHVDEVQALQVLVLQLGQFVAEDHGRRCAVPVQHGETAVRLGDQRRLDDGQDRRDAAAGREREIVAAALGFQRQVEAAFRRHHVERDAGPDALVGPGREQAALHALDGDAQLVVLHGRADGVGAAHVLAVDHRTQREVLALAVLERVAHVGRHVEGDGDRVARLVLHVRHGQWVELAHVGLNGI